MKSFLNAVAGLIILANLISTGWLLLGCTFTGHVFCGVVTLLLTLMSLGGYFNWFKFPSLKDFFNA